MNKKTLHLRFLAFLFACFQRVALGSEIQLFNKHIFFGLLPFRHNLHVLTYSKCNQKVSLAIREGEPPV